jgi:hypothetical protein
MEVVKMGFSYIDHAEHKAKAKRLYKMIFCLMYRHGYKESQDFVDQLIVYLRRHNRVLRGV